MSQLIKNNKNNIFHFSHQLLMNARSHTHAHSQRQKDYHHRYTEFYSLTHIHRYTMKLRVASSRIKQRQCLRIHTHLQNLLGKRNKRNEHRITTMKPYRRRGGRMKENNGKKMKFSHDFVARTKKLKIINSFFYFLNWKRISAANCLWSYQKMKYTFRRLQMLLQTTFTFFANSLGFRFLFFITLFCIYLFFFCFLFSSLFFLFYFSVAKYLKFILLFFYYWLFGIIALCKIDYNFTDTHSNCRVRNCRSFVRARHPTTEIVCA